MNTMRESSGRSWRDSVFGLWSWKKITAKVQRIFSIDSQKKKFKLENVMPINVQEVHETLEYFESMDLFFKLLLQTQGYGWVLKVPFGYYFKRVQMLMA